MSMDGDFWVLSTTMKMLASCYRRLSGYFAKLAKGFRLGRAMGTAGVEEFTRVNLLEKRDDRSALSIVARAAYRFYLLAVFLIALILAQWAAPVDSVPYFGALLALSAAWLFALPTVCDSITALDFSTIGFGSRAFRVLTERIRERGLPIPTSFSEEENREMDRVLPPIVATAIPVALLDFAFKLAPGAVFTGVVALLGLLIGPKLQGVHWWHGWTPASILFALPAPFAVALLASLFLPIMTHAYLAARKLHDLPVDEPGRKDDQHRA
jgi:hypothetical protein